MGLIHIYCGDGKGKTSAAFGLVLRFLGREKKAIIAQFLKNGDSGEVLALQNNENVTLLAANPTGKFAKDMTDIEFAETKGKIENMLHEAIALVKADGILVLDEVMAAVSLEFLAVEEVKNYVLQAAKQAEVVLTGRNPPKELLEIADYISEIQKIRHPYDRGISARRSVEW